MSKDLYTPIMGAASASSPIPMPISSPLVTPTSLKVKSINTLSAKAKMLSGRPLTRINDRFSPKRQSENAGSFVKKLYNMIESESTDIICWIRGGTAFHIKKPKVLAETLLPKYFRHNRFSSLIRQLNFYSFYKIQEGNAVMYQHSLFRKGRRDLLKHIKRRGAGKAKEPLFDPVSGRIQKNAPCSSPTAKSSSISTMSPPNKPGLPHTLPPSLSLNEKEGLKRSLLIGSDITNVQADKPNQPTMDDISSYLSDDFVLNGSDPLLMSPQKKHDIVHESENPAPVTGLSVLSREGKLFKEEPAGVLDMLDSKKLEFELEDFPSLSDDSALWYRPLSPLNLPEQNSWLDAAF